MAFEDTELLCLARQSPFPDHSINRDRCRVTLFAVTTMPRYHRLVLSKLIFVCEMSEKVMDGEMVAV